ncbi:hypothetical protein O3P69_010380 [Scylla paramamosain]|uniref:Uncharacterized protein n=1 Tax=Scylla paramamosain TaxID=85552 RepID=A0AAW0TVF5_SCYPA
MSAGSTTTTTATTTTITTAAATTCLSPRTQARTHQDFFVGIPVGVAAKDLCCATEYPKCERGDPSFTTGIRGSRLKAHTVANQQQASATQAAQRIKTAMARSTPNPHHCPRHTGGLNHCHSTYLTSPAPVERADDPSDTEFVKVTVRTERRVSDG